MTSFTSVSFQSRRDWATLWKACIAGITPIRSAANVSFSIDRDFGDELFMATIFTLVAYFMESDPLGLGGGINTYEYVNGNPAALMDPNGMAPKTLKGLENEIAAKEADGYHGSPAPQTAKIDLPKLAMGPGAGIGGGRIGGGTKSGAFCTPKPNPLDMLKNAKPAPWGEEKNKAAMMGPFDPNFYTDGYGLPAYWDGRVMMEVKAESNRLVVEWVNSYQAGKGHTTVAFKWLREQGFDNIHLKDILPGAKTFWDRMYKKGLVDSGNLEGGGRWPDCDCGN